MLYDAPPLLRAKPLETERNASSFLQWNISDVHKLPYEELDVKTVFLQSGSTAVA